MNHSRDLPTEKNNLELKASKIKFLPGKSPAKRIIFLNVIDVQPQPLRMLDTVRTTQCDEIVF